MYERTLCVRCVRTNTDRASGAFHKLRADTRTGGIPTRRMPGLLRASMLLLAEGSVAGSYVRPGDRGYDLSVTSPMTQIRSCWGRAPHRPSQPPPCILADLPTYLRIQGHSLVTWAPTHISCTLPSGPGGQGPPQGAAECHEKSPTPSSHRPQARLRCHPIHNVGCLLRELLQTSTAPRCVFSRHNRKQNR